VGERVEEPGPGVHLEQQVRQVDLWQHRRGRLFNQTSDFGSSTCSPNSSGSAATAGQPGRICSSRAGLLTPKDIHHSHRRSAGRM
jgi:hypothetical protein